MIKIKILKEQVQPSLNNKIFLNNISKIDGSTKHSHSGTANILGMSDEKEIMSFFVQAGLKPILSKYKISKFLGSGALGIVFSLESPHEDYVLKIQISDQQYGIDSLENIWRKQQSGKYEKGEINILDFKTGAGKIRAPAYYGSGMQEFDVSAIILSKVSTSMHSGKTGKITSVSSLRNDIYPYIDLTTSFIRGGPNTTGYKLYGYSMDEMIRIYEQFYRIPKKDFYAKLYETIDEDYDKEDEDPNILHFEILSKSQFVAIMMEAYKQANKHYDIHGNFETFDFHGGNFGFRPRSEEPISFDI